MNQTYQTSLRRWIIGVLCVLLVLPGCTAGHRNRNRRDAVQELTCTRPPALSALLALEDGTMAVHWADYENERTTLQIVDVEADEVCRETTIDGVWDLKEQAFSDGRLALCNRETNTWKFLNASLKETGTWKAENVDGYFSYDGSTYYYLYEHVLFRQKVSGGKRERMSLPLDLRLLELTAFDEQSGTLVMLFFLSPYGSECGTAAYQVDTGSFTMLQKERYRVGFCGNDLCMLSFDNDKMGYSVLYGQGKAFVSADADVFSDVGGEIYTVSGSPYLMGVAKDRSILYALGKKVSQCALADCGIEGEIHTICYLPDAELVIGGAYQNGTFRLFAIDPAQLPFEERAEAESVDSPLTVNKALTEAYWNAGSGAPLVESLQEARQYANELEKTYGVKILLSSQCKEPAALSDRTLTLTDTMSAEQEVKGVSRMLEALNRSLALYPKGFPAQFRNGMGDGGLCFLLVGEIESNFGVVGCAYDRFEWQYVALDVRETSGLEGIVCHELWHATENYILSRDYTAFPIEDWESLNPPGFSYYQDATLTDPAQKGTLYHSRPEEIHFVDSYACVDAKEDRARLMEYFMTHEDEAKLLIQSPFIRQKFERMCKAVRCTFDTTGWKDVRWERLL